jgi:hypothetical protein
LPAAELAKEEKRGNRKQGNRKEGKRKEGRATAADLRCATAAELPAAEAYTF